LPSPVPSRRVAAALAFVIALAASGAAQAQAPATTGDTYKQHMANGVKLYTDHDYAAAVAEFQAAYEAKPSANPLVNIALCDKEMFHYPEAIGVLITALARHGDGMDAADKAAAEQAISEMHALLGKVTVTVQPPGAKVLVDGEEVKIDRPIELGPGKPRRAPCASRRPTRA
jgi:tetratricopeptide (TPR) repeat protein